MATIYAYSRLRKAFESMVEVNNGDINKLVVGGIGIHPIDSKQHINYTSMRLQHLWITSLSYNISTGLLREQYMALDSHLPKQILTIAALEIWVDD